MRIESDSVIEKAWELQPVRDVIGNEWVREETVTRESKNIRIGKFRDELRLKLSCGHTKKSEAKRLKKTKCFECGIILAKTGSNDE